jgi:hypothetical protein
MEQDVAAVQKIRLRFLCTTALTNRFARIFFVLVLVLLLEGLIRLPAAEIPPDLKISPERP